MDKKTRQALLRGISQVKIFQTMTLDELREQIFTPIEESITIEDQNNLIDLYSEILMTASRKNLTPDELTNHLTNNYKLESVDVETICQFWASDHSKIHQHLISKSNFTSSISDKKGGLKWRIDQLTNPDDLSETTETVAVIELNTTQQRKVVFEVDKKTMFQVVDQLHEIQNRINSLSMNN